jgi:uncharacterized protein YciI
LTIALRRDGYTGAVNHYLYKLIPPRPSFALDMTEEEAAVMGEHATYWSGLLADGRAIVFGPVIEPESTWGLAVVEAPDEDTVRSFGDSDPAVTAGLAHFEVYAMPSTIVRGEV